MKLLGSNHYGSSQNRLQLRVLQSYQPHKPSIKKATFPGAKAPPEQVMLAELAHVGVP